jgi:hypothetical protein
MRQQRLQSFTGKSHFDIVTGGLEALLKRLPTAK